MIQKNTTQDQVKLIAVLLSEDGVEVTPDELEFEIQKLPGDYETNVQEVLRIESAYFDLFEKLDSASRATPVVCHACGTRTKGFDICSKCVVDQ